MKAVAAVRAKLGMPPFKLQYTIMTPANRLPLVQSRVVDLERGTTAKPTVRSEQMDFAPTHFVGSIAAALK
jgi:glutamate/aspartate transport system substrate-binding protein